MNRDEALEKIRKLRELATSENEHEAASAAAMAERLMTKFELDEAALDAPADDAEICCEWDDPIFEFGRKVPSWKSVLANGLSRHFGTFTFDDRTRGGCIIYGRASTVATVRYFFDWISREVERLARQRSGNGRSWIAAYRQGVVSAVLKAMRAEREAQAFEVRAANTGSALVKVENALALRDERREEASAMAHADHKLRAPRKTSVLSVAFHQGKADGANIYGGHRPQLGEGQRRIGG